MHAEALTKQASSILPQFAEFENFYLAGGTALALEIGHRISIDFDFFSGKDLSANLLQLVKRVFSGHPVVVTYSAPEQLNLLISNIQTTFLHYPYPCLDPLIEYGGVKVASIREIAAMKALAIGKRMSYKDYVDWYFLLSENHIRLEDIIAFCGKKFGNDFNDRLFLGQLVSLEDIPEQKINFLRDEVSRAKIEGFLRETIRNFKL